MRKRGGVTPGNVITILMAKGNFRHLCVPGQRFGRLLVIRETTGLRRLGNREHGDRRWLCRCDCGTEIAVRPSMLLRGDNRSCGCLRRERMSKLNLGPTPKPGTNRFSVPEYSVWYGMLRRCRDAKMRCFPNYGGRGIRVCVRWQDFTLFYADMGSRPSPEYELDRYPDNDGDYEPGNCRWALPVENSQKRRIRKAKTHCKRGHPFDETNTYWNPGTNSRPFRQCRACKVTRQELKASHTEHVTTPFMGLPNLGV